MARWLQFLATFSFIFLKYHVNCFEPFSLDWFCQDHSTELYKAYYEIQTGIKSDHVAFQKFIYQNGSTQITNLKFDPLQRTIVIVHGFINDNEETWIQNMTDALLKRYREATIITVDWSHTWKSNVIQYTYTVNDLEGVANKIVKFLRDWAKKYNKNIENLKYLHLIGHSLGAHIVGQVGKKLKNRNYIVNRITAFDPAKPYFDKGAGAHLKLNKSYADFVDVIHTNSDPARSTLGLYEPLGHIDFYPNGGDRQPLCNDNQSRTFSYLWDVWDAIKNCTSIYFAGDNYSNLASEILSNLFTHSMMYDHERGQHYFTQSIKDDSGFIAYKVADLEALRNETTYKNSSKTRNCKDYECIKMGIHAEEYKNQEHHGIYYVDVTGCKN